MRKSTPLVVEHGPGNWLWVENGLGWVLRPERHAWVPLEWPMASSLGGRVLRESQVQGIVELYGRPVVH